MTTKRRVIVVGSGPGGAAAALYAARAGADVLVLEAGREHAEFGLTARVRGITLAKYKKPLRRRAGVTMTGDAHADLFEELAPGGLSNHWSCAVPRFAPEDFADAGRAGEPYAWPIGYADLAPWYDEIEPLLAIAGSGQETRQLPRGRVRHVREIGPHWLAASAAANELGRTVVAMPYAYGGGSTVTFTGTPFNAFVRLLRPALKRQQLAVRYGARALKLEWSPASGRVERVVVRDADSGREERIACDAVVLAAGAVNTAQILLESTSADFPNGLGNGHGVLGRYFHDHPLGKLIIDLPEPIPLNPPAYVTRRALERSAPLYAAAGMQWSGVRALFDSVLQGHPGKLPMIGFSVFGTMIPTENDRVELAPERPRVDGASALNFHASYPAEAKRTLDDARDDIVAALEQAKWGPRVRSWVIECVGNSVHYGGTCRMHASSRFGMIDAVSRLHEVRNVAVGDSSAFTTGPEKNPVLTSMALAARAGDRLAQELRAGDL